MSDYTPGPWRVVTGQYVGEKSDFAIWSDDRCVALVRPGTKAAKDARLIAAAPELLEACRAALEYRTAFWPGFTAERLQKAIEKATNTAMLPARNEWDMRDEKKPDVPPGVLAL